MTPFQQVMILCFIVYPLLVLIQSVWIIWLCWFYRRGRARPFRTARRGTERGPQHSRLPLNTTAPTLMQMAVGDEEAGQPTQRSEVNAR